MKADARCESLRTDISARLDGEIDGTTARSVEQHLATCAWCRRYEESLAQVRRAVRLQGAEEVPDLAAEIMEKVRPLRRIHEARREWILRGRIAGVAALAAALFVAGTTLPSRRSPGAALASGLQERVRQAARQLTDYHATYRVLERGWRPAVPQRRFVASVWFKAPQSYRLQVRDLTSYPDPASWPRNDLDLIANPHRMWTKEPTVCPLAGPPSCALAARVEQRTIVHRAPFDGAGSVPSDIVVPLETIAGASGLEAIRSRPVAGHAAYRVTLPYRTAAPLVDALETGGSWRPFSPLDRVDVWLDRSTWFPLRFRVVASRSRDRNEWAHRQGLTGDRPGSTLLDVRAAHFSIPSHLPAGLFSAPHVGLVRSGGFKGAPSPRAVRRLQPSDTEGLARVDSGRTSLGQRVVAYADGLTWLTVTSEPALKWDAAAIMGAEQLPVPGGGTGYFEPAAETLARRLDVYGQHEHVALESNLPRASLLRVAASLRTKGLTAPLGFHNGASSLTREPANAIPIAASFAAAPGYLPDGYHPSTSFLSRSRGVATLTTYFRQREVEYDGVGIKLVQSRPAAALPPPQERHLSEVRVDGVLGRWSAERGELEWISNGTYRAVSVPSFDLATALRIAESLR